MPMSVVRYLALLVFLLGGTMFILRIAGTKSGTGYDTVRLFHILLALGLVALFEMALARSKRAGTLSPTGRQYSMGGRIALTLALLIGIFLLLSLVFSWVTGSGFDIVVYIHVLVGLVAVGLAAAVFWRPQVKS